MPGRRSCSRSCTRAEERFGRHDVDGLDERHPREEIEVRQPAASATRPDGDDEATTEGMRGRERQPAHAVFVDARTSDRPFERLERGREKHGLASRRAAPRWPARSIPASRS
jgi:hypothetical protein